MDERITIKRFIQQRGITQGEIAGVIGKKQPTVSQKLSGITPWTNEEIDLILDFLRARDESVSYETFFWGAA